MGHRAADEAKVDPVGRLEADRLERCRDPALHLGEVRGEDHVATSLPHLELVGERARRLAEVGAGDHVEHDLLRRADGLQQRPERLQATADAEVERQRSTRQKPIRLPRGEPERGAGDERRARPSHVVATTAAGFPGSVTQNRVQVWLAGRLKRARQLPLRSTMKRPTCIDDRSSLAQSTNWWPRSRGMPRAVSASEALRASERPITACPTDCPDAVFNVNSWVCAFWGRKSASVVAAAAATTAAAASSCRAVGQYFGAAPWADARSRSMRSTRPSRNS